MYSTVPMYGMTHDHCALDAGDESGDGVLWPGCSDSCPGLRWWPITMQPAGTGDHRLDSFELPPG